MQRLFICNSVRQFEFGKLQVGPTIVPIYGYLMATPFLEVTVITYGAAVQSLQVGVSNHFLGFILS